MSVLEYKLLDIHETEEEEGRVGLRLPARVILYVSDFADLTSQRRLACTSTQMRDAVEERHGSVEAKRAAWSTRKRQLWLAALLVAVDSALVVGAPLALLASLLLACLNAEGMIVPLATISLPIVVWCACAALAVATASLLFVAGGIKPVAEDAWLITATRVQLPAVPTLGFAPALSQHTTWGSAQLTFLLIASVPGARRLLFLLGVAID